MSNFLQGKLLIAMPGLVESTFAGSVVYLCAHSAEGAMGLIINKPMVDMNFMELAGRIDLSQTPDDIANILSQMPVHLGGPVEQQRGFVLHSGDYNGGEGSVRVNRDFALTATVDILQDMAMGKGPSRCLLALGYTGWSPGQLENEIKHNGWLHCDANPKLVFLTDAADKHVSAMQQLGIDPAMLSAVAGHD